MQIDFEEEAKSRQAINSELMSTLEHVSSVRRNSDFDFGLINDVEHSRWEAILNEDAIAELTYRFIGGRVVLLSTWVAEGFRNRGVATELVARVLEDIRSSGKKITVCPIVGEFISRNPQYQDLVDLSLIHI